VIKPIMRGQTAVEGRVSRILLVDLSTVAIVPSALIILPLKYMFSQGGELC